MYGIVFRTVIHIVKQDFGEDVWQAIAERAGVSDIDILTREMYPDKWVMALAEAARDILSIPGWSVDNYLHFFGACWIRAAPQFGYDKIIKVCGRYFCDFLTTIDSIHLEMRKTYPHMKNPFMNVSQEDIDGVVLQYRTTRTGLCTFLAGLLIQVAKDFYQLELKVEELSDEAITTATDNVFHFRLTFDNRNYMAHKAAKNKNNLLLELRGRNKMKIIATGFMLQESYPQFHFAGQEATDVLVLHRPKVALTWNNLCILQQVACEMELLPKRSVRRAALAFAKQLGQNSTYRNMLLRGKIRLFEEWNAILFLSHPLLEDLDDLVTMGIGLNALSLHGHGRDLVMNGWQHNAQLASTYQQVNERTNELENSLALEDEWKRRGDDLLYSMVPRSIANRFHQGTDAIDTCQAFECLTILFVELINDIEDLPGVNAIDVVNCIGSAFSCFDSVVERYDNKVYKAESRGNIYMVVAGDPTENTDHARDIAFMALDLRREIEKLSKNMGQNIDIRVGVHSGSAMAGVVGLKTPRYCFFGDTVKTASLMQTSSAPGKILVSQTSQQLLMGYEGFDLELGGAVVVEGRGDMETYWLQSYTPSAQ